MLAFVLSLLFGSLVGLSLGLLGGGGSILIVPILIYVLGLDPKQSTVLAMAVVGATSVFGAMLHARQGNVRLGAAIVFVLAGIPGSFLGAWTQHFVTDGVVLISLATVMLVVSTLMLRSAGRARRARAASATATDGGGAAAEEERAPEWNMAHVLSLVCAGVGVGFLTGFLGVGGGFVIVPALTLVARLPVKHAVGTSLVVIAANCASGLVAHRAEGFELAIVLPFLIGSLSASIVAARYAKRVSSASLKRGFAVFILVVAAWMLFDSLVLRPAREAEAAPPADASARPAPALLSVSRPADAAPIPSRAGAALYVESGFSDAP